MWIDDQFPHREILLIEKGILTAAEIDAKAAELRERGCTRWVITFNTEDGVMVSRAAYIGAQFIPDTISGIADCFRAMQEEETRRQAIIAHRDVLIARITTEKEVILAYFDHRFAERRAALDEFFELLRYAVDSRDNHQLNVALAGILGIIQDNPLEDFETFKQHFHDPDYVIEI